MTQPTKIATCAYCGTRTAFVLAAQNARQELTCSACGAPLDALEVVNLPTPSTPKPPPQNSAPHPSSDAAHPWTETRGGIWPGLGDRKHRADDDDHDDDGDGDGDDDDEHKRRSRKGKKAKKTKKKKRSKTLAQRFFDEAADAIEDFFD